jgi:hypothetical protein
MLATILSSGVCLAGETNTAGYVGCAVTNELEKKALAHLQRLYPHIEADRFVLVSSFQSRLDLPRGMALPITFADKASLKRFACREPARGRLAEIVELWEDSYTVLIRLDGEITSVLEKHLTDKQALSLVSHAPPIKEPDDRILELPKLSMDYSN